MSDTQIIITGPLFDGRATAAVHDFLAEAQYHIAAQGLSNVQMYMDRYFRHPTPYYETQVMLQKVGENTVVHDRGIIYGPWLAGTSHRNRITSFKGYPHWSNATADLTKQAPGIVAAILKRFLPRMT